MSEQLKDKALLARQSREDMISALTAAGYEVSAATPISEVCGYIRWMNGLRDICIAATTKDGTDTFIALDTWNAMSDNAKLAYTVFGVRVRAYGRSIVVALTDTSTSATAWSKTYAVYSFPGVTICTTAQQLDENSDGYALTEHLVTNTTCAKYADAAAAAWAYKNATDDAHQWYMPSMREAAIVQMFADEINAALATMPGTRNVQSAILSANLNSTSSCYAAVYNSLGALFCNATYFSGTANIGTYCRPVCRAD
jgi:hypothetical protein